MAMTEAPYSANRKVQDTQITVRAETFEEFQSKLQELDSLTGTQAAPATSTAAAPTVEQAVQNLQNAGVVENYDGRVDKKFDDTWYVWERSNAPLTNDGQKAVLKWAWSKNKFKMYSQWVHPDIATGKVRYPESKTLWQEWTPQKYDVSDLPKLPVGA